MPHREKQLIASLKKGDVRALEGVYDMYWGKIYEISLKYLGNSEEAEEAVQDIFLRIWKYRKNLSKEGNLEGYLIKVTQSSLINMLRKKRYKLVPLEENTGPCGENVTENQVLSNELEHFVQDIIKKLPPRRYEIYCMSRIKGMTYEEIAQALCINRKTVENHMGLALSFLRKHLKQYQIWNLFICWIGIIRSLIDHIQN